MFLCLIPAVVLAVEPAPKPVSSTASVRLIVLAVVKSAEENAAGPKRHGDALTEFYVQRAAAECLARQGAPRDFLLAIAVALDSTDLVRNNPLLGGQLKQVESDAERARRLKTLGEPTLGKRRDLVLHWSIAAGLTARLGPEASEAMSVAKEMLDARGTSGFSFIDLAADHAGIALARKLLADDGPQRLRRIADSFRTSDYLPRIDDLEEDLSAERFAAKYGDLRDPRYLRMRALLRFRALRVPGLLDAE